MTRRSLFQRTLVAASGCVLARTAFLGPRVQVMTNMDWHELSKLPLNVRIASVPGINPPLFRCTQEPHFPNWAEDAELRILCEWGENEVMQWSEDWCWRILPKGDQYPHSLVVKFANPITYTRDSGEVYTNITSLVA